MREDALNTKRAVAILLALSVVFHGSQPWSGVTQEACAQSKSASAKRAPKPTRVFSTRPSVDPLTPEAVAFSEALAKSIPSRLTSESLRKFTFKRAQSKWYVSRETRFSVNVLASDRTSWARGMASVPAGDIFTVFLPAKGGVIGIVESFQRRVGKRKADLERAAQLRAAGFKVSLLVDRFQVVLWDSLDPEGIEATVAKQPTLITQPLTPTQVAKLFFPPSRSVSGKSANTASKMPAAALAVAVGAAGFINADGIPNEKKPLNKYISPEWSYSCHFEEPEKVTKCDMPGPDGKEIKCEYNATLQIKRPERSVFYESKEACSLANKELAMKDCVDRKYTPQPINCLGAAWTPNQGEGNAPTKTLECPEASSDSVGFESDFSCRSINSISCPPKPAARFTSTVRDNGKKVTCNCQSPERVGPFCEQGANKGAGCFYGQMLQSETIDLNGADATQACIRVCRDILQKAKKELIECPGVEV